MKKRTLSSFLNYENTRFQVDTVADITVVKKGEAGNKNRNKISIADYEGKSQLKDVHEKGELEVIIGAEIYSLQKTC